MLRKAGMGSNCHLCTHFERCLELVGNMSEFTCRGFARNSDIKRTMVNFKKWKKILAVRRVRIERQGKGRVEYLCIKCRSLLFCWYKSTKYTCIKCQYNEKGTEPCPILVDTQISSNKCLACVVKERYFRAWMNDREEKTRCKECSGLVDGQVCPTCLEKYGENYEE